MVLKIFLIIYNIKTLMVLVLLKGFVSCPFFFQAEDGIRDWSVTGVQTCALPILRVLQPKFSHLFNHKFFHDMSINSCGRDIRMTQYALDDRYAYSSLQHFSCCRVPHLVEACVRYATSPGIFLKIMGICVRVCLPEDRTFFLNFSHGFFRLRNKWDRSFLVAFPDNPD